MRLGGNPASPNFGIPLRFPQGQTLDVAALFAGIGGDEGSLTDQGLAAPPQPLRRA